MSGMSLSGLTKVNPSPLSARFNGRPTPRAFLVWTLAAIVSAPPLAAQGVRGKVAEFGIAEPLGGASVWLMGVDGEVHTVAFTDSVGNFELRAPTAGWYLIRAHHFGHQSAAIEMQLQEGLVIEIRINLRPLSVATALDPVIVTAESRQVRGQREFLSRFDIVRGKKVKQEELIRSASGTLRYYLRTWGGFWASGCGDYFLDGSRAGSWVQDYPLDWVFGIEMYRIQLDAPMRYRNPDPKRRNCSVILIWGTSVGKGD